MVFNSDSKTNNSHFLAMLCQVLLIAGDIVIRDILTSHLEDNLVQTTWEVIWQNVSKFSRKFMTFDLAIALPRIYANI